MKLDDNNYVELAESAIKNLSNRKDKRGNVIKMVTTSKIRNLLAITADLYNEVLSVKGEKLPEDITGRINYLKVRFVYEAGRDAKVKDLVEEAKILECLNDIKGNRQQFIRFSRYIEALVAYHRFYDGKDS